MHTSTPVRPCIFSDLIFWRRGPGGTKKFQSKGGSGVLRRWAAEHGGYSVILLISKLQSCLWLPNRFPPGTSLWRGSRNSWSVTTTLRQRFRVQSVGKKKSRTFASLSLFRGEAETVSMGVATINLHPSHNYTGSKNDHGLHEWVYQWWQIIE